MSSRSQLNTKRYITSDYGTMIMFNRLTPSFAMHTTIANKLISNKLCTVSQEWCTTCIPLQEHKFIGAWNSNVHLTLRAWRYTDMHSGWHSICLKTHTSNERNSYFMQNIYVIANDGYRAQKLIMTHIHDLASLKENRFK